jgi:polysaccharide deacetylase family protein (PEP-CTERM system associated)
LRKEPVLILVNSFDVEPWWTTVPPTVDRSMWDSMPDRSEQPLRDYLDLCDVAGVRCTFFFIGWYARRFPDRVRAVTERGHEAGCHSLWHEDVAQMSVAAFRASTADAKAAIEDATGAAVISYRAPSFSIPTEDPAPFFETLAELGFEIDSSISTAARIHGGGFSAEHVAGPMSLGPVYGVDIFEIPVPGVSLLGREVQLFGGGYLRLAPQALLNAFASREAYQVLYMHPHDFDADLPDLPGAGRADNLRRRLRIGDPAAKVLRLLTASDAVNCRELRDRVAGHA